MLKKQRPFIVDSKHKHSWINNKKDVEDLYTENYKILLREIKDKESRKFYLSLEI